MGDQRPAFLRGGRPRDLQVLHRQFGEDQGAALAYPEVDQALEAEHRGHGGLLREAPPWRGFADRARR